MPARRRPAKKGPSRRQIEDDNDDDLQDDEDLLGQDNNNMPGNDQEELTAEERDEVKFKVLTSNNPQAPHNLTKFSWKERCFKTEDVVDQLVFHYSYEGSILLKDSDEARYQEEYWDEKRNHDNMLLNKINKAIKEASGKVPRKFTLSLLVTSFVTPLSLKGCTIFNRKFGTHLLELPRVQSLINLNFISLCR